MLQINTLNRFLKSTAAVKSVSFLADHLACTYAERGGCGTEQKWEHTHTHTHYITFVSRRNETLCHRGEISQSRTRMSPKCDKDYAKSQLLEVKTNIQMSGL